MTNWRSNWVFVKYDTNWLIYHHLPKNVSGLFVQGLITLKFTWQRPDMASWCRKIETASFDWNYYSVSKYYFSTVPELRSRYSKRERYAKLRRLVKQARAANKNGRCTGTAHLISIMGLVVVFGSFFKKILFNLAVLSKVFLGWTGYSNSYDFDERNTVQ